MTRKEAMEYDDSLKQELKQAAVRFGLAESSGVYIVDHYITVFPEDARKGMIFFGKTPASYKPGIYRCAGEHISLYPAHYRFCFFY